ncbi:MAG: GNAT family N-acetyltransferase [Candidatus Hodarchaeota archaeon]
MHQLLKISLLTSKLEVIEINIIELNESNIPEILELWKELFDFNADIEPLFTRREDAHLNYESYLKELMKSDDVKIFGAVDDENLIGFIVAKLSYYPPIYLEEKYGLINDLIVTSSYRRMGIGSRLIEKARDWFSFLGLKRIELDVVARNKEAYSFYLRLGFKDYMHKLFLEIK